MKNLYPALDAFSQDTLETAGGHRIYYEQSGNPEGVPVLFVHGGPGSSCNANHRRFFDPSHYHIILFDQRGCGRSLPLGGVATNDTASLIADMELLRERLNIPRWLLFGGSWGSTLCLAYAETYPARTLGLILRGIFLAKKNEIDWYLHGLRHFAPEAWTAFFDAIPTTDKNTPLAYFYHAVTSGSVQVALAAARVWDQYESGVMALGEEGASSNSSLTDEQLLARVRVQLHYLFHDCFLTPGQLLNNLSLIAHLPAVIVQGRFDMVCPPSTAYNLHRAWPGSQLQMIENGKHAASHPAMVDALVSATDTFLSAMPRR